MGPEKIRNDKVDRKWQNNAYEKGICGRRVLIEPYWNVKKGVDKNVVIETIVLIEPYWNVKEPLKQLARKYYTVLIEPYWNVKIFPEPKK